MHSAVFAIFISYKHDSVGERCKERLVDYLDSRFGASISLWHDRARIGLGQNYYEEIFEAIDQASMAICIVDRLFLDSRFLAHVELPRLVDRWQEGGLELIPLIAEDCPWKEYLPISSIHHARTYELEDADQEQYVFAALADRVEVHLGGEARPAPIRTGSRPTAVDTSRLPVSESSLIGRERELKTLDGAWEAFEKHVAVLIGEGGVGKSTLVNHWLKKLESKGYWRARRVFGWSFYSQGSGERVISGEEFLDSALRWFGQDPPKTIWERGDLLARTVKKERTLVVLDGLEPVQSTLDYDRGRILDPGVARFVLELSRENQGLLVITTRQAIPELKGHSHVRNERLDRLSIQDGAELLRGYGVSGRDVDLFNVSKALDGHALGLRLAAGYLQLIPEIAGVVSRLGELWRADTTLGPAGTMIGAFLEKFEDRPELELLLLMGLFQRPCRADELNELIRRPAIQKLTGILSKGSLEDLTAVVKGLRSVGLIAPENPYFKGQIDAHPLVREYFERYLRSLPVASLKTANDRLYRFHLNASPRTPNNLEELGGLYEALVFGCRAGHFQQVLDEVYWRRLLQGDKQHSWSRLGATASDLAAFSSFFSKHWSRLAGDIVDEEKGFVFGQAGLYLGLVARLRESIDALKTGIDHDLSVGRLFNASVTIGNLAAAYAYLGNFEESLDCARRSVELADKSGDANERIISRTHVGHALNCLGSGEEALENFKQAEDLHRQLTASTQYLPSGNGWEYSNFLLDSGQWREVLIRARANLKSLSPSMSRDYDLLALGQALFHELREAGQNTDPPLPHLEKAVELIRAGGQLVELPKGLLARAEVLRYMGFHSRAERDLQETLDLSQSAGMRSYEAECHLGWARLHLDLGRRERARVSLRLGLNLIASTNYARLKVPAARLQGRLLEESSLPKKGTDQMKREDSRIFVGNCSTCGLALGLTPHLRSLFEAGADIVEAKCPGCKNHTRLIRPRELERKGRN